ncbi:hypothetical protein [Mucilaginibacter paludis]|uniref:Uncharacterized protein n=1 Tax=Mucilaginibacter paludis DSM 18603 TaxID=714943 RepID=H1Y5W7_9SPHI|nr:hypothetical protein [Mucilaginibacter paludis]EHQ30389.1 hypothetical protein Mucpa_6333 [Mucilaginibacter paludis DSM 18603]
MKTDVKAIISFQPGYIDLSEKLRDELEVKIDQLYAQNRLDDYVDNHTSVENATKGDWLCAYLLRNSPNSFMFSGELSKGIKTWFNMYYDDRLSVIDKFRTYYQNIVSLKKLDERQIISIVFCKFLINELLSLLAESRWQNLAHQASNHRQILCN